jgi:hypothetical protein
MSGKSKSAVSNQKNQFDGSRKEINAAIDRVCEFTGKKICMRSPLVLGSWQPINVKVCIFSFVGLKVIFWDLQQPFIDNLYKNSVPQARLDTIVEVLDLVCS